MSDIACLDIYKHMAEVDHQHKTAIIHLLALASRPIDQTRVIFYLDMGTACTVKIIQYFIYYIILYILYIYYEAWRPHLVKDIDVLERVQRRATRMVDECAGMEYGDWR
jgi:hypothetical protein